MKIDPIRIKGIILFISLRNTSITNLNGYHISGQCDILISNKYKQDIKIKL